MESDNRQPRRVMVVADPSRESAAALQYALSHAVVASDDLILVHVINPLHKKTTFASLFKREHLTCGGGHGGGGHGGGGGGSTSSEVEGGRDGEFLEVMMQACEAARRKMKVSVRKIEVVAADRAAAILFHVKTLAVDLLIVGQRRSVASAILGPRKSGSLKTRPSRPTDAAEYLIENCPCTCVGVQKKGQRGGYLLNTKTHRNFWLLA